MTKNPSLKKEPIRTLFCLYIWCNKLHPTDLNKRVQGGELIYVENYVRSDGTKVHGYYRRRPYFASKKSST